MIRRKAFIFSMITIFVWPICGYSKGDGIELKGALGYPSISIMNPDGKKAGYGGVSLEGRVLFPILEGDFSVFVNGVSRYHDIENRFSSSTESELANHLGFGAGLLLQYQNMFAGYDYMLMKARHYYVGAIGVQTEYDYTVGNLFFGVSFPVGPLSMGFGYSMASGAIEKSETGLSKDSDYKEQTIWIHLQFSTGTGVSDITSKLVN